MPRSRETLLVPDEELKTITVNFDHSLAVMVGFGFTQPDGTFKFIEGIPGEHYQIGPEVYNHAEALMPCRSEIWNAIDKIRQDTCDGRGERLFKAIESANANLKNSQPS